MHSVVVADSIPPEHKERTDKLAKRVEAELPFIARMLSIDVPCKVNIIFNRFVGAGAFQHFTNSVMMNSAYLAGGPESRKCVRPPGTPVFLDYDMFVLAHELQHYKQVLQKRLSVVVGGGRTYNWEGGIVTPGSNFDEYFARPWEQEANSVATAVALYYQALKENKPPMWFEYKAVA